MHFDKARHFPTTMAFAAAAAMLLLGFGALNLFWAFDSQDPSLPGLYDYRAATWGDGLFLPIGAGSLTYYVARSARLVSRRARMMACAASLAGAAVGVLIQASWLADESIAVNWTIPRPGEFAPSGWYHAAFFSFAIAFFSGALVLFFAVRARKSERLLRPAEWVAEMLVWVAAFGYLAMHLLDDYLAGSSILGLSFFLLALGVAIVVLVCLATMRRNFVTGVCRAVPGLLLGVGLLVYSGTSFLARAAELAYLLATAAMLCASFVPSAREGRRVAPRLLCAVTGSVGAALVGVCAIESEAVSAGGGLWYVLFGATVILLVTSSAVSNQLFGGDRKMIVTGACIAVAAAVYAVMSNLSFAPQGMVVVALWDFSIAREISLLDYLRDELLFVALVALCVVQVKRFVSVVLKGVEDAGGSRAKRGKTARRIQGVFYFQLVLMIGGMLVFMTLSKLSLTLLDMGAWSTGQSPGGLLGALAALPLLAVACFLLWVSVRLWFESRIGRALAFALSCMAYIVLVASVSGMRMPLIADWWSLWALFVCIGAPLFVGESFLSNCVMLRGGVPRPFDVLLAALVACGCLAVTIGAVLPTAGAGEAFLPTILSPGMSIAGILLAYVAIPFLCATGYASGSRAGNGNLLLNDAPSGVLQNGVAASTIVVFLGVFPLEVYLASAAAFAVLFAFVLLMASKLPKICFPLEANVAFLGKRVDEAREAGLSDDAETARELRSLSLHLQRQAVLTSAALIPWSMVMVCAYAVRSRAVSGLRTCADDVLRTAWAGLLLRPLSKGALLLFADLFPIVRERCSEDLDRLADEGIRVADRMLGKTSRTP